MSKKACNEDCFNCKYPDCIINENQIEDKEEKRKEQRRNYYLKNRERILEYTRKYHEEHREERSAKAKERHRKPSVKAKNREYYLAHREEIIKKNLKNYYRRKDKNEQQKRADASVLPQE